MPLLLCLIGILILVVLIAWVKLDTFLSFMLVSILLGLSSGMGVNQISHSLEKGIGEILGSLVVILGLGAMLGRMVAESGAAQQITRSLTKLFGKKYLPWGMALAGLIVGIPLFYTAGFVVVIPLVFAVAASTDLPILYLGLPMLTALSVAHGFLPPHPSPTAIAEQLHASIGKTLLYGLAIAIPTIILAGPVFASTLKKYKTPIPYDLLHLKTISDESQLPSLGISLFCALLPLILLSITTVMGAVFTPGSIPDKIIQFIGNPDMAMFISVLVAGYYLGIRRKLSMTAVMTEMQEAFKGISVVLLIIAGSGIFMQVMKDAGVDTYIAAILKNWEISPLILGWLIAAIIRICIGSATVAGLTTVGILLPIVQHMGHPELMVLSIGAGSLMLSHFNDGGFWLFKEYFNLSIKDTFKTWTAMETMVSICGLIGVLLIRYVF